MNDLTTRVAKQIAFHGRNIHDTSEDAEEFWANTATEARDIALMQARAVVALVLDEAAARLRIVGDVDGYLMIKGMGNKT